MSEDQLTALLNKLKDEKAIAFAETVPDAPKIKLMVSQLNELPASIKPYFDEFIKELKSDLFTSGADVMGLEFDNLNSLNSEKKAAQDLINDEIAIVKSQIGFDEILFELISNIKTQLEILKGYFLLRLENSNSEEYELLILHDEKYYFEPIKKIIEKKIPKSTFKSIKEFNEEIATGKLPTKNLVCLLLLSHRGNDDESIKLLNKDLLLILDQFKNFDSYTIKDLNNLKGAYYLNSNVRDDFFDEITEVTRTFLSNGLLSNEEEKMVKKLFTDIPTPLLIYKILKGGKSGAKVIEVIPKKTFANTFEKRYRVKYAVKDDERKIKTEVSRFGKFIKGFNGFNEYESNHANTLTLEGIRYSYAISPTEKESFSFSDILEKSDNKFFAEKSQTVDKLFDIQLFEVWKESLDIKTCKLADCYSEYIKPEKICKSLSVILDKTLEEINADELLVNFNKIWNHEMAINTKVCHGDLHSDNFFCDTNGVYLIDFGFTDVRHAILDHTSLECSIKFKHFPFYVTMEELDAIEDELLLDNSFNLSNAFVSTNRAQLIDLLEVIKKIRYNSIGLLQNQASYNEYYISLFLMTFRQIRYDGMNQLYAYNSAKKLASKIVRTLGI